MLHAQLHNEDEFSITYKSQLQSNCTLLQQETETVPHDLSEIQCYLHFKQINTLKNEITNTSIGQMRRNILSLIDTPSEDKLLKKLFTVDFSFRSS